MTEGQTINAGCYEVAASPIFQPDCPLQERLSLPEFVHNTIVVYKLLLCDRLLQSIRVEYPNPPVRPNDERQRERVPVLVGAGRLSRRGLERTPVAAVVGGDVSAVGANGDPGRGGGVVGYGGAVAVGWGG